MPPRTRRRPTISPSETRLLGAAIGYVEREWPVIPLGPRAKTPLTAHGLLDASIDPGQISEWWDRWPDANIGLRTGVAFDVLDIDGPDGLASLARFAPGYRHTGPVASTGKGWHLLFAVSNARNGAHLGTTNPKTDPTKLDFRGQNGYIVAAPSIHPNGHEYSWTDRGPDLPLPETPYWLTELIFPPAPTRPAANPNPIASRLLGHLDLQEELSRLGVVFKQRASRLVGQCPFHADDTPSLVVYPNDTFYCFGCTAWGDALNVRNFAQTGRLR